MSYRHVWKPNASQRKEYAERMRSIERANVSNNLLPGYTICCTGDCCRGDEVAFFNPGKSAERLYGVIISENYGKAKQQHTFTIDVGGERMFIKGRNFYKNEVFRKMWPNENERVCVLEDKHRRGEKARAIAKERKASVMSDSMHTEENYYF